MSSRLRFLCTQVTSGKHDVTLSVAQIAGDPYPICCYRRMNPADKDEYDRIKSVLDRVDTILAENDLPPLYDLMNYIA